MKLFLCSSCYDIQALTEYEWRSCKCGRSGGRYDEDGDRATVAGDAVLYGVSNILFRAGKAEAWKYDESNGKITRFPKNARLHQTAPAASRTGV